MLTLSTEEKLALLLSVLGEEAASAAFASMNPTRAKYVSQLLAEFKTHPPSREEVEYVVKDFNNYFSFALDALGPQIAANTSNSKTTGQSKTKPTGGNRPTTPKDDGNEYFPTLQSTDDPVHDLNRLAPYQIAKALELDHPKTVAMVLRMLATPLAAEVIANLPEATRSECVVYLSQPSTVPDKIVQQVLASTFSKGNSVTVRVQEVDQAESLAELLRTLPKDMRKEILDRLAEEDEELVASVKGSLYVFEDILRLGDRDIQKVLGEIETDNLIVALQKADAKITDKIMGNLSKRARETIEEEMQYKEGVSQEEIDEARQSLITVIGRLDEAGDITLG